MSQELTENEVRRIAREEAETVVADDIHVEDSDGEEWSISKLMNSFEIERRTALAALGLIAAGYHAPRAVLTVFSQPVEAASQDNLNVPGTLTAGAVDTESATIDGLPGVPLGDQESGSPYTATGADSITVSNLDSFNSYIIFFEGVDGAGSANNVTMQVGGDTGTNYRERYGDGTSSSSVSEWGPVAIHAGNDLNRVWLTLTESRRGPAITSLAHEASGAIVTSGDNTNVSWPPSQFTLSRGAATDWTVRVWGRDV